MRTQDLIEKKRDCKELTPDEIAFLIRGYTRDEIPDYQMAAWLMASFLNGMSETETQALVEEMLYSGIVLTHEHIPLPKVDKHSTGGVGDKTSLVIGPVAAACGVAVPMISGRALAHTGGTLDKLEAIPGFRTNLSLDEFKDVLARCGLALIGQTREIAPADRKLYALRDLTATVPFRPFMCASIMSKKLAEGIDGLVLDVKTGNGAFMREFEDSRKLAEMMTSVGRAMGKRVVALITDMNQPLGRWVGNAVETFEAIETLHGDLEGDFAELCLDLAAQMLIVGGIETDLNAARHTVRHAITSGHALERFRACIEAQGGNPHVLDDPKLLSQASKQRVITAPRSGFVTGVETDEIGRIVMDWGGGRRRLEDKIDHSVGLRLFAKLGDQVDAGDPLAMAYYNDESKFEEMDARLRAAYRIEESAPKLEPLIKAVI
ncbi:MAG: Pyrimidine-nucleoside phosphorylase [Acidobacteria bacterium]|nr:Pyrimidine-nucleoside phosphorylase [Acidobacteriota bacterium]